MTIDDLALLIQNTLAKKEDLAGLATKDDLKALEDRTDARLEAVKQELKEDIRMVRQEVKMLNFSVEIDDLRERMQRVEHQLGIK